VWVVELELHGLWDWSRMLWCAWSVSSCLPIVDVDACATAGTTNEVMRARFRCELFVTAAVVPLWSCVAAKALCLGRVSVWLLWCGVVVADV